MKILKGLHFVFKRLLWWVFWLTRRRYVIGVFVAVINEKREIMLVRKRLGGDYLDWQLPGGGKQGEFNEKRHALIEAQDEAGIIAEEKDLEFVSYFFIERNRDLRLLFYSDKFYWTKKVNSRIEIKKACFFPQFEAFRLVKDESQKEMIRAAYRHYSIFQARAV